MDFRFESGKIVGARGWDSAVVVDSSRLLEQAPSATPLLVEATREQVTIDVARTISALHGAGRPVVLVTDSEPSVDVAQWIPGECLHLMGTYLGVRAVEAEGDAEADGYRAFFGPYAPNADQDTRLEVIIDGLEADELWALAGLLENTPITIDMNREWWMRGSICLHGQPGGWDRRDDIMEGVGFVGLPLRIGESLVLGVGDIKGQYCDEGCYLVTGSWRHVETGSYRGIYTDGTRDVSASALGILLCDWSDDQASSDPEPLPLTVRATPRGEEVVLEVAASIMLEITRRLLEHGAHGFERAKPQLQTRLDEFRVAAAEYVRDTPTYA